jgi:hypothetical protein
VSSLGRGICVRADGIPIATIVDRIARGF